VLPFLHNTAVYVAPLRVGSGTRLKLLQAMAAGCAIVSTHVGAQGLGVTPDEEMMLADSPEGFAQATVTLLRDPVLRKRMGQAAQRLVCEQYDWSAILPRLLKVYREMGLG
jgi:glycosyltransferase involved in cell wall biosynthesis